ncbi:adenosylcobinamide-phosphate synthase CbiB [Telmatospirillum sp. J64-1]|uniref:adenosylcobinamide-phosphate synthase CbiB n=1 Tax=Telmatospirillum sp. J64-1 TaxID=2502183 RepID=UPI0021040E99|nr:adenosylcobinamide-phosphate synthase CbiB [Telmatospirillum sp. J64-1]
MEKAGVDGLPAPHHPAAMLLFSDTGLSPLLILLLALALDAVVGEMSLIFRVLPHPVAAIGKLIGLLERKLNRPSRTEGSRRMRGILVLVFMLLLSAGIGWGIAWAARQVPYGWIAEVVLASLLIAQRSLYDHVREVARALEESGLWGGRVAVSMIVGRDPQSLDEYGVSRAAIESCAENFSDGIVAPVFWFVLFGLPGLLVYKTVNTLDSMIGHMSERYRAFGMASARLDDLMNLIPARLSGLLLVLAASAYRGASGWRSLRIMLRDAGNHRSPNSGWPEAAMAGALDLALAGPRRYGEVTVPDRWIGDGKARATATDIRRALNLYVLACVLNAALVAGLFWVMVHWG